MKIAAAEHSSRSSTLHAHNSLRSDQLTLNGSKGSGGGGVAAVLTAQNMHPRVLYKHKIHIKQWMSKEDASQEVPSQLVPNKNDLI
jgi:hypothetical protein